MPAILDAMATEDICDAAVRLLKTSKTGDALFQGCLVAAELDFKSRGETLDDFLPGDLREKLQADLKRKAKQYAITASNLVKKNTRSIWLGLFEEARSSGYTLTSYIGTSDKSPDEDNEWEYAIKIYKPSYTALHALTKAHKKPPNCSPETATGLYVYLPVAFLAAIVLDISRQPGLENIVEYGFGWDSGDAVKWRPGAK
jgi:hypothetical protein